MSDQPAWLKIMENSGLGEARAKAFLLDRFWVLERSVDIQGADYLIQRKLTNENFLDQTPPRLGVVQVKYIQDEYTTVYLNAEYVEDDKGVPYGEFFLLVFSGREDTEVSFLFSGKDIVDEFKKTEKNGKQYYRVSGSGVFSRKNYKVVNKKLALGKIEHALKHADFYRNRRFLETSNYFKVDADHIDHDLLIPLDNGYCDIREEFFKYKKNVQRVLFDIEEVVDAINKILRATDPIEAYSVYEQEIEQYIGSGGWGSSISFNAECFREEDFVSAVMNHKERLEKIRELNVESNYLSLIGKYESEFIGYIIDNKNIIRKEAVKVEVAYKSDLSVPNIVFKRIPLEQKKYPIYGESKLGFQQFIDDPARGLPREVNAGKVRLEDIDIEETFNKQSWMFRRAFHWQLDTLLLGDELAAPWMEP